jgi:predicted metal-dependent enzyme (double-stranded beta helix superfamily)
MNLTEFSSLFNSLLEVEKDTSHILREGRLLLTELLGRRDWFADYVNRLLTDRALMAQQKPSLWPNEITLHRHPDGAFVMLAYIWEPRALDIVHDHGSWGIIGAYINKVRERKYRRLDDGNTEGYAQLEETADRILGPREITVVRPLDDGIHQMENVTDSATITVNVYGRSVRKGYSQHFYPEQNAVRRVYPPRTHKEVLLIRSLGSIREPWAGEILVNATRNPMPDHIRRECELSLSAVNNGRETNARTDQPL